MGRRLPLALFGLLSAVAASPLFAQEAAKDLAAAARPGTVEILTTNEDGSTRETKIWIVELEGSSYIRTGGTRWYANLERRPDAVIRSEGIEYAVRVELVADAALANRVEQAFREKYGFSDRVAGWVRFGTTHIMRLGSR